MEVDANNNLVKFGVISSDYTEKYYDYRLKIKMQGKEKVENDPTDTGHYYIIVKDKENNMTSGGQFYVLSEMKEKYAYNIAGTDTYMVDGKLDVSKWQKDKTESGFTCY